VQARLNATSISPNGYKALLGLQSYVNDSSIEKPLLELVKVRASQMNGFAFCLAMHIADAVRAGETHERLHLLGAWEETGLYSERERATLAWTEALTRVAETHVPDEVYEKARRQLSEKEMVDLSYATVAINAWNRINIAFRTQPQIAKTSPAA
jgi:AhpD family alkylhydroperoxidase